ncbi:hypothetical protein [Vibrio harveyi]
MSDEFTLILWFYETEPVQQNYIAHCTLMDTVRLFHKTFRVDQYKELLNHYNVISTYAN